MCMYCERTEEFNPFIDEQVDFLPCMPLQVSGGINAKMLFEFGANCGNDIFTVKAKINYCPMCGRKL